MSSNQRSFVAIVLLLLTVVCLVIGGLTPATLSDFVKGYRTFITVFLGIFIEALPFLLLGTLASGLVEEFVNRDALGRLVPHNRFGRTLVGALMGLAFPVCECGVVPLTRRLFRKGIPLPVGVSFLLAAPIINPVVIASTFAAFGWGPLLLGRIAFALLIAVSVGLIFGLAPQPLRLLRFSALPAADGLAPSGDVTCRPPLSVRSTRALAVAGEEFFEMGRLLVLGSLLAAGMQTVVSQPTLLAIGRGALPSIITMLSLAFVLSVCSTVDAFLALAFASTFTTGSILGFLVFGPMVDVKSVMLFFSVFRRRATLYLILLPLMMTLLLGVYVNLNLG